MKRVATDYAVTRAQKRYIARLVAKKKQDEETAGILAERAKLDETKTQFISCKMN